MASCDVASDIWRALPALGCARCALRHAAARSAAAAAATGGAIAPAGSAGTSMQGLTLAHFLAQPKPFWSVSRFVFSLWRVTTRIFNDVTQCIPQKVLTLSREVDECKPLPPCPVRPQRSHRRCPAPPPPRTTPRPTARGLHSCRFQLNVSSSVLRETQLKS